MASAAVDDEDIALSINPSYSRRGSTRALDPNGFADQASRAEQHAAAGLQAAELHQRQRADRQATRATQQRLGQYHLIKTLGEGSFGKVKLAIHQTTSQKVALKIISRRKLVARDMAGRVEREIQYLQLLRHPHIIKLYTVITTPNDIVMVLEYAGSELFNYIVDHGKMPEDKARKFFQQIVCAVEYCHRHKIVHRDLKPENLLLDDNLHVKIADFGLSNIMTDGNFLKTSCGSPNYAAPEVISGKLYAGPEVDVWSCGVILYVLLVGRLPFDDEYIPALFKKIASGQYHVPHYLSHGAVRLIKKMLQVSPVHRITVQEIRQDPWFMQDLPSYLQPPVEEFMDTGVDPNKAIDPRSLAPNKPPDVQEKIHESVVGKLGKTMGYGREDVQQALAIDEPNAIKDAYLIVRENQLMKGTPSIAADPALQPFLAQSPPANTPAALASVTETKDMHYSSPGHPERPRQNSAQAAAISDARSPINTVGVLPSSLPDYHKAFMEGQPHNSSPSSHGDGTSIEAAKGEQHIQSPEQQAATARRLKPHSRSQMNLERLNKPEGMTPVQPPQKKPKTTKWQFGIRSRNQPAEAMLAIYKALKAMNAEWEIPKTRHPQHSNRDDSGSISGSEDGSYSEDEGVESRPESGHGSADEGAALTRQNANRDSVGTSSTASSGTSPARGRGRRRLRSRYSSANDWGYRVPNDPWIINARFRKDNMFPPGVHHPHSAHSSRGDLVLTASDNNLGDSHRSRRSSTLSSAGNPSGSNPELPRTLSPVQTMTDNASYTGPAPTSSGPPSNGPPSAQASRPASRKQSSTQLVSSSSLSNSQTGSSLYNGIEADDSAFVYMTIQLYSIEKEFYLVDFKCAGYERLVRMSPPRSKGKHAENKTTDSSEEDRKDIAASPAGEGSGGGADGGDEDEWLGEGRAADEKDVSSPFPFLDVASRLIIQLAEAE